MENRKPGLNRRTARGAIVAVAGQLSVATFTTLLGLVFVLAIPPWPATAAVVSGFLLTAQGQPAAFRSLHLENRVSRDVYLCPTHQDGSFHQELPPGDYSLRGEHGVIVVSSIPLGEANIALGKLTEPSLYALQRIFERQEIAPSILTSPAPSTAYIMTRDTTVLPASATLIVQPALKVSAPVGAEIAPGPAMEKGLFPLYFRHQAAGTGLLPQAQPMTHSLNP